MYAACFSFFRVSSEKEAVHTTHDDPGYSLPAPATPHPFPLVEVEVSLVGRGPAFPGLIPPVWASG